MSLNLKLSSSKSCKFFLGCFKIKMGSVWYLSFSPIQRNKPGKGTTSDSDRSSAPAMCVFCRGWRAASLPPLTVSAASETRGLTNSGVRTPISPNYQHQCSVITQLPTSKSLPYLKATTLHPYIKKQSQNFIASTEDAKRKHNSI